MTFAEAMEVLLASGKVRRELWFNPSSIYFSNEGGLAWWHGPDYGLAKEDAESTDWIKVE